MINHLRLTIHYSRLWDLQLSLFTPDRNLTKQLALSPFRYIKRLLTLKTHSAKTKDTSTPEHKTQRAQPWNVTLQHSKELDSALLSLPVWLQLMRRYDSLK